MGYHRPILEIPNPDDARIIISAVSCRQKHHVVVDASALYDAHGALRISVFPEVIFQGVLLAEIDGVCAGLAYRGDIKLDDVVLVARLLVADSISPELEIVVLSVDHPLA